MNNLLNSLMPVSRFLLAFIFLMAGVSKITGYAGTEAYMASAGVPGILLPLVILLEILGAISLIIGYKVRWSAPALAIFCIVSALIFHFNFADQIQSIMFMKNLAIAGGLLALAANGAGAWSLDNRA
ncbi:MAG: DoxX family protein [Gammaproteobacteria bacterium]|jgi:putative oxidoreductase|nr:DoxX family protein [Gammaproteobacteria bacterium]